MAGRPKQKPEGTFYRDLGRAIRTARVAAGKSQTEVAEHLDITFQQLQKYENGRNRIPVDRLVSLADILRCRSRTFSPSPAAATSLSPCRKISAKGFHALFEAWSASRTSRSRRPSQFIKRTAALYR